MADGTPQYGGSHFIPTIVLDKMKAQAAADPATARVLAIAEEVEAQHVERSARWAGRPIKTEQDMVAFYRVMNPDLGDDYARLFWAYMQERGIRIV